MGIDARTEERLEEIIATARPRLLGFLSPRPATVQTLRRLTDERRDEDRRSLEPV